MHETEKISELHNQYISITKQSLKSWRKFSRKANNKFAKQSSILASNLDELIKSSSSDFDSVPIKYAELLTRASVDLSHLLEVMAQKSSNSVINEAYTRFHESDESRSYYGETLNNYIDRIS